MTESIESGFSDLALILLVAGVMSVIFKRLKQPVVLGYIVAGFLIGPHFDYFLTISDEKSVDFWAQVGILFLLFSLGLEFSFKKLMHAGGSAAVTALVVVAGMMSIGYLAGRIMGFTFISSLFLGGMLSMSSTTIILKALTDLNLMHRRFTSQVLAVLIVQDLFAVVLLVLLSSIAVNNNFEGSVLAISAAKLVFFLVLWFLVGVYVIPQFLLRQSRYINDELLLVISVGLCFVMVVFSVYSGFSAELGAFVMGSILAGTSSAERITKLVTPLKDLFGAIFFVSVGMMVDPSVLTSYAGSILVLSVLVIVGMILFGTFGMLLTGKPLRIAIESGFCLTQIGEFSFIIASLGVSLGVINNNLYPIVVSVSVITTFFTPYFIRLSDPFSRWVEQKMPVRLKTLLDRYSTSSTHNESELVRLWKQVAKRSLMHALLYSVLLVAIIYVSRTFLFPFLDKALPDNYGRIVTAIVTLIAMAPFLFALSYPNMRRWEADKLRSSVQSNVPFFTMRVVRLIIAFSFVLYFMTDIFSQRIAATVGISLIIMVLIYFSKVVRRHMYRIEDQFMNNLNERELRRSGRNNNLVSDMHLAYVTVGYNCPFAGEKLSNSDIGHKLGVNVVSIQRGDQRLLIPDGKARIFPGDMLGVIGTDDGIQRLLDVMDSAKPETRDADNNVELEFTSVELGENSTLAGKTVAETELRNRYNVLLVSVEHPDGTYEDPTGSTKLVSGDNLWLVGVKSQIQQIK